MSQTKGGFTLPGESGYEDLTLKMAEKWGADVIRDSDGTVLSAQIVHAVTTMNGQRKIQINCSRLFSVLLQRWQRAEA